MTALRRTRVELLFKAVSNHPDAIGEDLAVDAQDAVETALQDEQYPAKPRPAKPRSVIAQDGNSGTEPIGEEEAASETDAT